MNRRVLTLILGLSSLGFGAASALAQGWPLPAKTPATAVTINCMSAACLGKEGKKLVGYPRSMKTFTGRFLDSVSSRDYQFPFRTARARMLRIAPDRNRVYMINGSALAAYDLRTFFTRLESGETLWPSTSVPVTPLNIRYSEAEVFLKWDAFFYAESGGGWLTQAGDGQERLFGFDWDDRGNVYLAYGAYSWGIVKDDGDAGGTRMPSVYQHTSVVSTDESDPVRVYSLKSGTSYYLVVSGQYERVNIFDVTTASSPSRYRDLKIGPITELAKSADGQRIALVKGDGSFAIYKTGDFLANSKPLVAHDPWSGSYSSVVSDGTNFFAGVRTVEGSMAIAIYSPEGDGYSEKVYDMRVPLAAGTQVRYGAGYLTATGLDTQFRAMNLRLYRLSGLVPFEVPLDAYYAKHYTGAASFAGADFTYPDYSVLLDTIVHQRDGKLYLLISSFGLGDVYELQVTEPPTGLVAGAVTTGRVDLSWNPSSGASSYTIERRQAGSDYTAIRTTTETWYSDRSVSPDTAYFYRVQANGDGGPSPFTAPDLATTVIFEDASLRPYSTVIRAAHMCQLQTAINAVRALAGLPESPFSPVVAGGVIQA
ncbi:MAG: fibronectin type III domain-containing protein, partial [Thermoanaerobaculia bacterium]